MAVQVHRAGGPAALQVAVMHAGLAALLVLRKAVALLQEPSPWTGGGLDCSAVRWVLAH